MFNLDCAAIVTGGYLFDRGMSGIANVGEALRYELAEANKTQLEGFMDIELISIHPRCHSGSRVA